jgi:hypothetical protein
MLQAVVWPATAARSKTSTTWSSRRRSHRVSGQHDDRDLGWHAEARRAVADDRHHEDKRYRREQHAQRVSAAAQQHRAPDGERQQQPVRDDADLLHAQVAVGDARLESRRRSRFPQVPCAQHADGDDGWQPLGVVA